MAFLCPVRIRRNKKKKGEEETNRSMPAMGRITGSASIETLVRVGLEKEAGLGPESKMVVLHDFTPCVDDELEVKRGQIVHVLYQENDWVYVISEDSKEGFIPYSYTAQFGSQLAGLALNVKKKLPRDGNADNEKNNNTNSHRGNVNQGLDQSDADSFKDSSVRLTGNGEAGQSQSRTSSVLSEASSQPEVHPFYKDACGRFIVLYSYQAQDENDLSVDRGQCVTVLNKDDPEWFWVMRADGLEGFVPAGFVYPLDAIQRQQSLLTTTQSNGVAFSTSLPAMTSPVFHSTNNISRDTVSPPLPSLASTTFSTSSSNNNNNSNNNNVTTTSVVFTPPTTHGGEVKRLPQPAGGHHGPAQPPGGLHSTLGLPATSVSAGPASLTSSSGPVSSNTTGSSNVSGGVGGLGPNQGVAAMTTSGHPMPSSGHVGSNGHPMSSASSVISSTAPSNNSTVPGYGQYSGTELVMLYDYKAQAPDDLSVRRGDWVYADLNNQTVDGWLWAYAPKTRKYGFIPKAYARPPAMTSL